MCVAADVGLGTGVTDSVATPCIGGGGVGSSVGEAGAEVADDSSKKQKPGWCVEAGQSGWGAWRSGEKRAKLRCGEYLPAKSGDGVGGSPSSWRSLRSGAHQV